MSVHGTKLPLVPVTELMVRGRVRMSMMFGDCSQGMRKWEPSLMGSGSTPCIRSYMTARSPASTAFPDIRFLPLHANSDLPSILPTWLIALRN